MRVLHQPPSPALAPYVKRLSIVESEGGATLPSSDRSVGSDGKRDHERERNVTFHSFDWYSGLSGATLRGMYVQGIWLVTLVWGLAGCGPSSGEPLASGAGAGGDGGAGGAGAGGDGGTDAGSGGVAGGGTAGNDGGPSDAGPYFSDDFDTQLPGWVFDATDPSATYSYEGGALRVSGGSAQAFAWYPVDPTWGDDYEVEVRFTIESGMVGGVMLRGQDTSAAVEALNCNLREDLAQLRAARHTARNYQTLAAAPASVELGTQYVVRARVTGATLTCTQADGPTVTASETTLATGSIGLFVYMGQVRFESIRVGP